ncbi:MAG: ABC transporter ATP-binding protein [Pseudorhodoplanes sp.]
MPILKIENLQTSFVLRRGTVRAVNGVSCALYRGETLSVVGESGCGKSVMALSILRLLPKRSSTALGGKVLFEGRDLMAMSDAEMRKVRGGAISMIFQEPMSALNPIVTVGRQIRETIILHQGLSKRDARDRTIEMLGLVGIPDAARRFDNYPYQMSGGMLQRVMIAMALSCNPKILLADEPTTALDVTIQAQILRLMAELQEKLGIAIVLITHDMGVVAESADRVIVMYAGRKVEEAPVEDLFETPCHPYTRGLLESIPRFGLTGSQQKPARRLNSIPGAVPPLYALPEGCAFQPRCRFATEQCRVSPPLEQKRAGHWAACWHSDRMTGSLSS